ncbi:aldose epimerase family protein [Oleiharenicola lentus]|uniref:aldose epimerase family protein n=1 Tax=Oleiharenicola lentus TaxID=2508720 RepID=UPI003F66CF0C
MASSAKISDYGVLPDARAVKQYVLTGRTGVRVTLLDYGATVASVELPDRAGKCAEVTHGYDDLAGWMADTNYFGATIGRFGNRIADGKFSLEGKTYPLAKNNMPAGQPCHLHGGKEGFNKKLWSGRAIEKPGASGVEFSYVSPDGEEGYPGALSVRTTYWLSDANELTIEYRATTDRTTIINLTNHTYWNLTGDPRKPITRHEVQLNADAMLPVTPGLIPTGARKPVAGTPFDFTKPTSVGARIDADDEQLNFGNGYDHCWVLRGEATLRSVVRVEDPKSGRVLELLSDQAGLQLYTGNFLDGKSKGRHGHAYEFRTAFCLEPQRFPDAPNQPQFPSAVLHAGEVYTHTMVYRFATR